MDTIEEYLPILDEEGNIVGTNTRANAHKRWLIHGHVHVWIPDLKWQKLILQKRRKPPHKLDATAGWHIWFPTFEESEQHIWSHISQPAILAGCRETREETWIRTRAEELVYIDTVSHLPTKPGKNWELNRTFTPVFLAMIRRNHADVVSPEVGTSFISASVDEILKLEPGNEQYIWQITQEDYKSILRRIRKEIREK